MFSTERQRLILEHLKASGAATVQQLAKLVDCSEVTVRRDLLLLDEQDLIERHRGGAAFPRAHDTPLRRVDTDATPPSAHAILAATLVRDGETIALGAGPMIAQLAAGLTNKVGLTVITNSLLVGDALATSDVEVAMSGGSLRGATMALVGTDAERIFTDMGVRRAFLSGDGLTSTWGLSCGDAASAGVERAIAAAAQGVVVLVESATLGVDAMSLTVPAARIDDVVTDDHASAEPLTGLRAAGMRVHVATSHAWAVP